MKYIVFVVHSISFWITFVSCNALGVALYVGIGDGQWIKKQLVLIVVIMIIDYNQMLKDPYNQSSLA